MQQVVSLWNVLPKDVIVANSLEGSKRRPDTYMEERSTEEKKDLKK